MKLENLKIDFRNHQFSLTALIICLVVCPSIVQSGQLTNSDVQHENGRFTVHSSMLVHLPAARVREILTNFENLPRINKNITGVNMLGPNRDGSIRMQVASQVCALFVCLDYSWVQQVNILPSGDIVTRFDPAVSDFSEGWVRYQLLPEGGNTRLITDAVLVPKFWFPPLVGPMLIKSKLRNEALNTATGIETVTPRTKRLAFVDSSI